jgi:hypothetical protein
MRRIFKKRFSMAETIGLLTFVVVGVAVYAWAVTTVPNTFTSGTTAIADEVNANFSALATAIDTISLTPGPQGATGPTGATGATGATGSAGSPDTANQVRDKFFTGTSCVGNSASDIMVKVGPLCVDKYEASVWSVFDGTGTQYGAATDNYPGTFPDTGNWTTQAFAVSKAGVLPSASLTWFQAQQACALSEKRLLTNAEWQMAAANTPDSTSCNVSSGAVANTGSFASCVSNRGVNDMVGNVWEWVADWVQGNTDPWAPSTGTAGASYGDDLMYGTNPALSQDTGSTNFPAALLRGGRWIDGTDAGVFALDASVGPSGSSSSFGFRCAR